VFGLYITLVPFLDDPASSSEFNSAEAGRWDRVASEFILGEAVTKGRFYSLLCLLPHLSASSVLTLRPAFISHLLDTASNRNVWGVSSSVLLNLLTRLHTEIVTATAPDPNSDPSQPMSGRKIKKLKKSRRKEKLKRQQQQKEHEGQDELVFSTEKGDSKLGAEKESTALYEVYYQQQRKWREYWVTDFLKALTTADINRREILCSGILSPLFSFFLSCLLSFNFYVSSCPLSHSTQTSSF